MAFNVDDASYKSIEFFKEELAALDSSKGDVDVDMKFTQLNKEVVEI
jgi:hypothetical protein